MRNKEKMLNALKSIGSTLKHIEQILSRTKISGDEVKKSVEYGISLALHQADQAKR